MSKIILLVIIVALAFLWFNKSKKNKQLAIENASAGSAFLAENAKDPDVVTTDSGLQFKILQQGTGDVHPNATDQVKVHYHGTLVDGRIFDSSVDRGEPISFGLNQVIKGWTEGVQLMVVGEKRRLFIPSELAYGQSSAGIITPGSTLIFDVELLEIN
ncbi:MAG: FKBP-type peptidyl-prolyl cis-trans isomerase [Marinomonas sp.]|jgi:peptidylprolyl isomerase|uniref:FKBP-type peptidyl-prolyl cis-trans isomerase n=1 Tax=unclassified Marinomonas TaxID=196814 RepID=UPI0005F9F425|nr:MULTISPECIES: FKBP-type peptidyl-prolyl cis-trans isomerase [unclassified Marinomonas]KJZ10510.1 peptidylprolyl isomerase [Marinomonas sp. S3726]KZM38556.1 peptidylprolyl isomerase [Marinomonas sp. SBI22]KZM41941.1 peptidylprolyl isomerase [Marinomonas sp. SBI8L]